MTDFRVKRIFMSFVIAILVFVGLVFLMDATFLRDKLKKDSWFYAFFYDKWYGLVSFGVIAVSLGFFTPVNIVYSDGLKVGTLTKVTKKGVIFKTYEGQMNLGGMVSDGDGGMVANVFNFSITDEKIFNKLKESQGKRVKLKYLQYLKVPINVGSTSYIIQEVQE